MDESTVSKLTLADFPSGKAGTYEVMTYVAVSQVFGNIGECYRRAAITEERLKSVGNDLYVWLHELPCHLQLFNQELGAGLNTYDFVSRQVHVLYFTALILLLRAYSPTAKGAVLAASFIAAVFEEFLIRDEVRYLPAIYKFFLLTERIMLMPSRNKFTEEINDASADLAIIKQALRSFAERHPPALANLHTLERMERSFGKSAPGPDVPVVLDDSQRMFFRTFGPGLCRQWCLFEQYASEHIVQETSGNQAAPTDVFESGAGAGDLILPLQWYDTVESTSWILDEWPLNFLEEPMAVDK